MDHVTGFDHAVILVRDLDQAQAKMEQLGFAVTPRGLHSAKMGTANNTIMFRNGNYFELLSVIRPTPQNKAFANFLERREGLSALAFQTDDAVAAAEEFKAAGIDDGPAIEFVRPVSLADGLSEAAFTVARIDPARTPGAAHFVCQHHTPDVTWRPDFLDHANGVQGLASILGLASDLDVVAEGYGRIFGDGSIEREDGSLRIDTGTIPIVYVNAERLGELAPGIEAPSGIETPALAGLAFETVDLPVVHAAATTAGFAHKRFTLDGKPAIAISANDTCGTIMIFVTVA